MRYQSNRWVSNGLAPPPGSGGCSGSSMCPVLLLEMKEAHPPTQAGRMGLSLDGRARIRQRHSSRRCLRFILLVAGRAFHSVERARLRTASNGDEEDGVRQAYAAVA